MAPRLEQHYYDNIQKQLGQELGIENVFAIPKIEKISVNMGVGEAMQDKKVLELAAEAMAEITGQKPVLTLARNSIAGFKLREGVPIGCKVTLRGERMYEFLDRIISIVLPRVRDFRGVSRTAFDGHGNYSMGLNEWLVFPELSNDKFAKAQGLNITIVTTARSNDHGRRLLEMFGMPLTPQGRVSQVWHMPNLLPQFG
ncbi:MAG: 50S ribosomal protein L5 [Planctomycetaceae bacterium]|nr:50S ribosomal protein L5 [Planctomycetaceae bacterium]